jgi:hypothetical protein
LHLSTPQLREGGPDSVPAQWAASHPDRTRTFSAAEIPHRRPPVPRQDNHCDCGLFVLAYSDFFCCGGGGSAAAAGKEEGRERGGAAGVSGATGSGPPPALNAAAVETLRRKHKVDGIDLWEGPPETAGRPGGCWYPGLLTQHWFPPSNASALRTQLKVMILRLMAASISPPSICYHLYALRAVAFWYKNVSREVISVLPLAISS